jgi:hypothetical protein
MQIAPSIGQTPKVQKKSNYNNAIIHWILMVIFWLLMFIGGYCVIGIRTGDFVKSDNTVLISAIFALGLLMATYSIGVTLFFFINLFINKFQNKKYDFFVKLNGLMLLAFIILWAFALITF